MSHRVGFRYRRLAKLRPPLWGGLFAIPTVASCSSRLAIADFSQSEKAAIVPFMRSRKGNVGGCPPLGITVIVIFIIDCLFPVIPPSTKINWLRSLSSEETNNYRHHISCICCMKLNSVLQFSPMDILAAFILL